MAATCTPMPPDSLDLSVNVKLTDNFALTFDGVNLLDEELFQYYDD